MSARHRVQDPLMMLCLHIPHWSTTSTSLWLDVCFHRQEPVRRAGRTEFHASKSGTAAAPDGLHIHFRLLCGLITGASASGPPPVLLHRAHMMFSGLRDFANANLHSLQPDCANVHIQAWRSLAATCCFPPLTTVFITVSSFATVLRSWENGTA